MEAKGFFPHSLSGWVDLLAKMGAGAVLVIAYLEYRENQRTSRVERVQDYLTEFQSGDVAEARRNIRDKLREQLTAIETLQQDAGLSAADVVEAKRDIGAVLVSDPTFSSDLEALIEFLDSVQTCIETEICERSVATANFASQADWVFKSFDPVIPMISNSAVDGFAVNARELARSANSGAAEDNDDKET